MTKEDQLRKSSHKILLLILKFIPMITALGYALNVLLAYFGIDAAILSHLCGMSLLPWLFILIATFVFRFCIYHRMFLYYILLNDLLNILDYYIGIPISTSNMIMVHMIVVCIFLFLILCIYVKHRKKVVREAHQEYRCR